MLLLFISVKQKLTTGCPAILWLSVIVTSLITIGIGKAEETEWKPGNSNGLRDVTTSPTEPAPYPNSQAKLSPIADTQVQPVAGDRYASSNPTNTNNFQPIRQLPNTAEKSSPRQSTKLANDFQLRLTALELAVSTVVAERPNLWRFEPLEAEATQLLLLSSTEADRQAVRQLAERLEHFSDISDRYRKNRTELASSDRSTRSLDQLRESQNSRLQQVAPKGSSIASTPVTSSPQYDATGVLRPVVSKRPNAPKFALVDDRGQVTTFVSPSAGVDLESLVGKRLGVRGNRGFIPEYQREHVTAERVATLDRVVR